MAEVAGPPPSFSPRGEEGPDGPGVGAHQPRGLRTSGDSQPKESRQGPRPALVPPSPFLITGTSQYKWVAGEAAEVPESWLCRGGAGGT